MYTEYYENIIFNFEINFIFIHNANIECVLFDVSLLILFIMRGGEVNMKKTLVKPVSNRKAALTKVNYLVELFANESVQNNGTSACQNNAVPRCKNSGCRSIE